tara:strand:- start:574 stop:1275 length:702 start_codon:yes stop_codon:yes gene_type:complete
MNNSRVLILSDTHFPYEKPMYFKWIKKLKTKINPTNIIHIGDLVDFNSLSFWEKSPSLKSAVFEIADAKKRIKKLESIFPEMNILLGNHDIRIQRLGEKAGIPDSFFKSLNQILDIKSNWTWNQKLILPLPNGNKVFLTHHFKSSSLASSKELGMSFISGHQHTVSNLSYWSSPTALNFAMTVGCSIDPKHEAFKYGKNFIKRPIISVASIINSQPALHSMPLDENGEYTGKI